MKSLAVGAGLSSSARPWAVFVVAGVGLALAVGCNGPLGRPYGTAYPYAGGNVAMAPGSGVIQTVSYTPTPMTYASSPTFAPTTFASTSFAPTTFAASPMVASVSTGGTFASPSPYPMLAQLDRPGMVGIGTAIYGVNAGRRRPRHMAISAMPGSRTGRARFQAAALPGRPSNADRPDGVAATPGEDLIYRGGKTIRDLQFMNIYVGGTSVWDPNDVKQIDWALGAAMADRNLNNVIMQYFNNQPVSATSLHSQYLTMPQPQTVSQGDVEALVTDVYNQGGFKGYALGSTLFNFMLPRGTVLNDNAERTGHQATVQTHAEEKKNKFIPDADEGDSSTGLGGYHGSVHIGSDTVYYAVGVYSERRADGTANGIPVFDKSWKNVVATFYHELQEARTDADVEDAIKGGDDPSGASFLGWTSEQGEEIGDFPVSEVSQLGLVFKEVPLADGSGTVPIQLIYSNAVHGPEGPIAQPHGGVAPPVTPAPRPPSTPSPPPTAGNDPDLNRVIKSWPVLPQQVKTAVLSVIDVPCR